MTTTRRSDLVRARRLKRPSSSIQRPMKQRYQSNKLPPMVSRVPGPRPQAVPGKHKEARRRYNIALKSPGAEIRLPALPQIRFGWRILSAFLAVTLTWTLVMLWNSPSFRIQQIEVFGIQRLKASEIDQVLKLYGSSVFSLNPAAILEEMQAAFPELENIEVKVKLPARVMVAVTERTPILSWDQAGFISWVDANGVAFLPRGEAQDLVTVLAADAPPALSQSETANQILSPELVQAILMLNDKAPQATQLLYHSSYGLGWVDPDTKWQVYFGLHAEDMDQRLIMYDAIVKELNRRNIKATFISVQYLHAPYYRLD